MRGDVPFLDLGAANEEVRAGLDAAYARVSASGWYLLGPELDAFEAEFAAYCAARHCVGVGSGLDALVLALRALGVGPGDEVIVPAHTFIATWLAVSATGARPVPVEPDERTYGICPDRLAAAFTPAVKAVLVVHLYGHPVDLDAVRAVADRHDVPVVEDAAQAHGAAYRGRPVGAGGVVAFSFYPAKNLGALGDGGAVVTDDPRVAERVRLLRNYGSARKYDHQVQGGNSRLDEFQAAVLRAKLPHLDEWTERRARVARRYTEALAGLPGLVLPSVAPWASSAWHLYVVRTPHREALRARLADAGVATLVHYPVPAHRSGAYRDTEDVRRAGPLPISERLAEEVLSLPIGPHLPDEGVETVVTAVRDIVTDLGAGVGPPHR
ncbi:DegT/DnrJ/EryC1/StrS family aminotransferase [Micromonospora sp. KC207]|uniref:DegT/DnrJ/EryC1/StrS family aminotransferase n=1 Tax=Micromonospora sp. KC207 TaxID=2530377 RepID=UPI00104A7530|nr:DegT/DnrJ/EryC1/StrS family aminotransferase [Micromonospora sp. KC207]TDC61227.1 DegT/DnrJ/EryC1/StrS family aminotransferase [Micromonospora sp. KC207]